MANDQDNQQKASNDERLIMQLAAEVGKLAATGIANATERVLESNSDVVADDETIMSLIYEEILAGEQRNYRVSEDELIKRFPDLQERISRLLAFHQSFSSVDEQNADLQSRETDAPINLLDTWKVSEDSMTLPAKGNFDQFEIEEKIGQGGMGIVYRARQKKLNRLVALKLLRNPLIDSLDRSRLMNEAQAVAKLQHPAIVQIHYVGESEDQPYLCFEYVDGIHLAERLQSSTLAPDDACRLLGKIANAVSYAHEHGIIHRDLKPANILMDSDGEPKVADFGLAKLQLPEDEQTDRLTQTGAVLGTICYMAPEQFTGGKQRVDHRADIYGLGAIFYEMLTGRPPQIGDTPDATMYQVTTQEPVSPRKLNGKIPRDVETICLKCLEKDPHDRFQTSKELERELQRYLNGETLSIRPASPATMAIRWCKRRPAIAMLSTLSALLLIALTIGGYWMAWNQTQYASELQKQRDLSNESAKLAASKAVEAEAAAQFMINTLGSAHPDRDGRNVTVAERLVDGLREIEESYPNDSTAKASLLEAIGKTYKGLGLTQESVAPLKRAWELYTELNGPRSLEALTAETSYADTLRKLGRHVEAEGLLVHAENGLNELLGLNASESIMASICLAQNTEEQGHPTAAFDIFEDCYDRAREFLPPTHSTTIKTVLAYTDALKEAGQLEKSRKLVSELIDPVMQQHGNHSLLVLDLRAALASIDRADGRYSDALKKYEEVYQLHADKLGDDHIKTLISLNGVAISHADMGNYDRAIDILTDIKNRAAKALGKYHPQTLRSVLNVARTMESLDRHQDAHDLIKETYERALTALDEEHPETMMMATHYGRKLAENNKLERAEELLTKAVAYFRNEKRAEPFIRGEPFIQLASLYKRTDRVDQAIDLYTEAVDIARDAFGEYNPATLTAKNNLAGAYFKDYQSDKAIKIYLDVLAGLRKSVGEDNPKTLKTALNLGIVLRDEDRAIEAIDVLLQIVPVLQQKAKGSWLTSTAEFQLGRAYLDNDQVEAADRYLEIAYAGYEPLLEQMPASQRTGLGNQIKTIVSQFEKLGQVDIANNWQHRANELLNE